MLYYGINGSQVNAGHKGVILLAEFCECGSLLIGGRCSNKNCSLRAGEKPAAGGKSATRKKATAKSPVAAKPAVKTSNPRRASKMITYNLYETKEEPES